MAYLRGNAHIPEKIFMGNFLNCRMETHQKVGDRSTFRIPLIQMLTIVTHFPYLDVIYF